MADNSYGRPPIVVQPGNVYVNDPNSRNGIALNANLSGAYEMDDATAKLKFREFFRNFRLSQNNQQFIYRDALIRQWDRREYFVEVDLSHVNEYDETLSNNIQISPAKYLEIFESAAKDALKFFLTNQSVRDLEDITIPDFQIILKSSQHTQSLRNLTSIHVNRLIKVPGIVIKCSDISNRATVIALTCTKCGKTTKIPNKASFGQLQLPSNCEGSVGADGQTISDCGKQTLEVNVDQCRYIDQQMLKLQENPEVVPTGEMPRNIRLHVERYLIDRVSPGTRVAVIGIFSSSPSKQKASQQSNSLPFLRVVGLQVDADGTGRTKTYFSPQEEEQMQQLARDPNIYDKLSRSIAPSIQGEYTRDIKKAIACLLIGGSRTILRDGTRLRGDINVLLMGDPSTAKSQFLKFVERVAPIGVYTSGKGSSAAGLTAAVVKDSKGEFYLEGGAMVLADGGVICIDEFDKMRETDRVAIHEAMEQQTISVAKAGITTVLNSRASVLAAANPIYGRYDDLKGVGENIDLMTTILSRFDCIFIVRDVRDQERDRSIARHVLGIHVNHNNVNSSNINSESTNLATTSNQDIDSVTLKKFITYCRERCAPRLNDEAAALLSGQYVHIRGNVRKSLKDKPGESQVVPITVRQLEALIRISESLAKMRLSAEATVSDVEEAIRLFRVSTLAASESNPALMGIIGQASQEVQRAEEFFRAKLSVGHTLSTKIVMEEALMQGHSDDTIKRAVAAMIMKGYLQEVHGRKYLRRIK